MTFAVKDLLKKWEDVRTIVLEWQTRLRSISLGISTAMLFNHEKEKKERRKREKSNRHWTDSLHSFRFSKKRKKT